MDAGIHAEDLCLPWLSRRGFHPTAARTVTLHCIGVDLWGSDILAHYTPWWGPLRPLLSVDTHSERLHFGSLFDAAAVTANWDRLARGTAACLADRDPHFRLAALGASLHAVHDFYAHSNWWQLNLAGQTWQDLSPAARAGLDVHTATGHGVLPPPGRCSHEQLNADHPARPGFAAAFAAAHRATGQWLDRCREWAGRDWDTLRAWSGGGDGVATDYAMVAALAAATGHWRGPQPLDVAGLAAGAARLAARCLGAASRQWVVRKVGWRLVS